jgi:hypothetical protein
VPDYFSREPDVHGDQLHLDIYPSEV